MVAGRADLLIMLPALAAVTRFDRMRAHRFGIFEFTVENGDGVGGYLHMTGVYAPG